MLEFRNGECMLTLASLGLEASVAREGPTGSVNTDVMEHRCEQVS